MVWIIYEQTLSIRKQSSVAKCHVFLEIGVFDIGIKYRGVWVTT
jgi:hypothetical protein